MPPCFDDIPEDYQESFPCPECVEGNVTKNDLGMWECDICSFAADTSGDPLF
jgi:ribosomal protein L37AE/L43A